MNRARLARLSIVAITMVAAGGTVGCAIERDQERDGGYHPGSFIEKGAPGFHGTFLRDKGYPLAECRSCHGEDYAGGVVGTSCNTSGCHSQGVESCGTCHDGASPPEPATGGHAAHANANTCSDCHVVPKDARSKTHPNGNVEVVLSGLATTGLATPEWNADDRRCAGTYCHGGESPVWETPPGSLGCDGCHGAPPPAAHARFPAVTAPEGCAPCHPIPGDAKHLDGKADFAEPGCGFCHGNDPSGAPPKALGGGMDPSLRGVGAHQRHLDETLGDRIGRVVACEVCHDVPKAMRAGGHLDDGAPADVRFFDGSYDVVTGSCVVGCHWDQDPGPLWTDTSGAPRACDACHGFPPVKTRAGTPHPLVPPLIDGCSSCHHFEAATHVDGHVDLLP